MPLTISGSSKFNGISFNGQTGIYSNADNEIIIATSTSATYNFSYGWKFTTYKIQNLWGNTIEFQNSLTSTGMIAAGIPYTSINASAILQADSTTKGFLPPRMTTTQKNAIATPAAGLMVYDTTLNKLCVRTASAWETITST
jgi:hypothetical protein